MAQRAPALRDNQGHWLYDLRSQITPHQVALNEEMQRMKDSVQKAHKAPGNQT
jgi:hypothetical protein